MGGGKSASELGEFKHTAGEHFGDAADKGIQTSQDARFYGISAKMDSPFTNKGKELVVQMSVKHEQDLDCGGAYIKLLGPDVDQAKFGGETPYQIMFGPDICGYSNRKTHAIFHYEPKKENLLIKDDLKVETDKLTHLYTLVVKPDNTFEVFIDLESVRTGTLEEGWDFLLPKQIPDPDDKKPEGYDDIPAEIPDPDAKKPDDWDDEEKGEWEHPLIDNPDYKEDKDLYLRCKDCTHVGFELWQVKSGTIFDDIIVTDSFKEAKEYAEKTFMKKKGPEKEMYDAKEAEKKAEADRVAAENAAAADEEDEDDEDDEHDEL